MCFIFHANQKIPDRLVVQFAGIYLDLTSMNIGQTKKNWYKLSKPPHWHVGSSIMFSCASGHLVSCTQVSFMCEGLDLCVCLHCNILGVC